MDGFEGRGKEWNDSCVMERKKNENKQMVNSIVSCISK